MFFPNNKYVVYHANSDPKLIVNKNTSSALGYSACEKKT